MNRLSIRPLTPNRTHLIPLLVALAVVFVPGASVLAGSTQRSSDTSSVNLYAITRDSQELVPLSPSTLKNKAAPPIALEGQYPVFALSADGSTFVRISFLSDGGETAIVQSGPNGPERGRFSLPSGLVGPQLNADGSRLLMQTTISCGPSGCGPSTWYTFDTTNGHLLATIDLSGNRGNGQTLFDPSGSRLYYAAGDPTATSDGPWPLTIVAYDLNTGQESTRLSLPSILIGTMYNGVIDQVPVANVMAPAIALSPDGSRIAVVHADSEQLTLIDAQHMTVIKTVPVVHPKSILNRLFSWVAPQTAEAKYMTGSSRSAVFSADGRSLYVYGSEATITEGNREVERGLGLELVDANSGEIKAAALDGVLIDQVLPGPGGQNLYLSGPDESWYTAQGEPSYTVRRLDAATLDTHAQRTFPDVRRILLAPTVTS